jgi:tetratricopeptide (TPR) repeat protein
MNRVRALDIWLESVSGQLHGLAVRMIKNAWTGTMPTAAAREKLPAQAMADANAMLGNGYLQSGQYDKAVEALNNAIRHDPQFAKAYYLLGMARSCQAEHGAAIGHYSQAIALRPDKASYYFCRARAHEAMGKGRSALEDYSRVLQLEPDHHGARLCYNRLSEVRQSTPAPPTVA